MNNEIKTMLLQALELKEASIRRAMKTAANPRFSVVYEAELADLAAAEQWVRAQK